MDCWFQKVIFLGFRVKILNAGTEDSVEKDKKQMCHLTEISSSDFYLFLIS